MNILINLIPNRFIRCISQFIQLTQFVFIYYTQSPERLRVPGQFAMPVIGGAIPARFMLQMVVPDFKLCLLHFVFSYENLNCT